MIRRTVRTTALLGLLALGWLTPPNLLEAQTPLGSTFNYRGRLEDAMAAANGSFDFQFKLFDALSSGSQLGSTATKENVNVSGGLFTVELDFGAVWNGDMRFLEIGVRPGADIGAFTILTPRQKLDPVPHSLFSLKAGSIELPVSMTGDAANELFEVTNTNVNGFNAMTGNVTNPVGVAIVGQNNATTGAAIGVLGFTASTGGIAVQGQASTTTGETIGVRGHSASSAGTGVRGQNISTTGSPFGVQGTVVSSDGTGVMGDNTSATGDATGVWGNTVSPDGTGVLGQSESMTGETVGVAGFVVSTLGAGVLGQNNSPTGVTAGVAGQAVSPEGVGVFGENTSTTGNATGVWGNVVAPGGFGVFGQNEATSAVPVGIKGLVSFTQGAGVFGENTSLTGATVGVVGRVDSIDGAGVFGRATSTSGGTAGVHGRVDSPTGSGVFGDSRATTGFTFGVHGVALSTDGRGVFGDAKALTGSEATGVWGESDSATGSGLVGIARHTSGANVGVWGQTDSSAGLAGFFAGNVSISGSISKSSGSFKIDHPLDPAGKYLFHSFVESPDMKNLYDGTIVLDGDGEATVELPDYFEALNRDFRYQLTPIGGPAAGLFIAQEILANSFRIGGGPPNLKVSWQVTGTRQDAYALKHPIIVEVEKSPSELGSYIHPDLFGRPKTESLAYKLRPGSAPAPASRGFGGDEGGDKGARPAPRWSVELRTRPTTAEDSLPTSR